MGEKAALIGAVVLIVFLGLFTTFYFGGLTGFLVGETITLPQAPQQSSQEIPQLSLEGYVKPEIDIASNVIFLTSSCHRLSMFTTDFQAGSIERGQKKIREFRPLTHDLIEDILDTFEMEVLMVKIEKVDGDTYFAKILIQQGNKILNLDSRPSDAIAIAFRQDAPVYIKEDLLRQAGVNIC